MIFLKNEAITFSQAISISITGIIVVMIILALLAVLVVLLSKAIRAMEKGAKKNQPVQAVKSPVNAVTATNADKGVKLPETQSAGQLDLYKTDEKTAAVIMAIVSYESKIPLNRLKFNSIKLIDEQGE
jgi:Na+-transporting methylmalonyl-CoA/oxaloacetate decarboxylase gamma subunit